jgi:sulfate transport system permease protein
LPTAVGGIALTAAYAPHGVVGKPVGEWFAKFAASKGGHHFLESHLGKLIEGVLALDYTDFKIAYTRLGIIIALIFISLPFVVRTVQPVLQELDVQLEEAAASLGAGRWATFRRVILPYAFPAILTGFALGFARAIGEYGSVVFIAANLPMKTEIAPLLIANKLGEDNIPGATGIAVVMLVTSFILLLSINGLQYWTSRRTAA